ncbi:MAG: hypothetical protein JWQ97_4083, partial [Phenylobacterium sp.]|nr:hypothetical protein [Phenylobacterium sp.]
AVITGNTIEQGPNSQNPNIVAYGEEGGLHAGSAITMSANTVLNDLGKGSVLWDASGTSATVDGTKVWGVADAQMVSGSGATVSNTTHLASEPGLDTSHPWAASGTTPAPGPSAIDGTAGDDVIAGQADGPNAIRGLDGADRITGGLQYDEINGNRGDDTIIGRSSVGDSLMGGQGNDLIDTTQSSAHNDVNGNRGADTIHGSAAGDTLRGGQGDDLIVGGSGADWISGDMGQNTVTGGGGADVFHASANGGVTTVTDFSGAAGDRIQLDPGASYHLAQQGADLHIVLDGAPGGDLVLQQTAQAGFQTAWILQA